MPTWLCHHDVDRSHVLAHLDEMVVKPANGSGGNGVFVGSMATKGARDEMRRRVEANPRNYIAQPIVQAFDLPDALERAHRPPPPRLATLHPLR